MNINFIVSFWGNKYTDMYIKYSLPAQLSRGNLGSFLNTGGTYKYKIYTTSRDSVALRGAASYRRLCEMMETEVYIIDDVVDKFKAGEINKYDVMTTCHGRGIAEAVRDDAAFMCFSSDQIISDGSLANIYKIASGGKRMVIIGDFRVTTETFTPELMKMFYSPQDGCISIPSRELVKLSLSHIHPFSKTLFWDSGFIRNEWPAFLYWNVEGEGILQRGIHLNPIFINPREKNESLIPTAGMGIDGYDYMQRAVPDFNDAYIICDSDEVTFVSLEEGLPNWTPPESRIRVQHISSWIKKYCCEYHINFLKTKIRFHHSDMTPAWEPVEEKSERDVRSILNCLDFFEKAPEAHKEFVEQKEICNRLAAGNMHLLKETAVAYTGLGEEFYKSGKVREAEALFIKALAFNPGSGILYSNLATIYWEQRQYKKSVDHLKRALELDPGNPDIVKNFNAISEMLGNLEPQNKH